MQQRFHYSASVAVVLSLQKTTSTSPNSSARGVEHQSIRPTLGHRSSLAVMVQADFLDVVLILFSGLGGTLLGWLYANRNKVRPLSWPSPTCPTPAALCRRKMSKSTRLSELTTKCSQSKRCPLMISAAKPFRATSKGPICMPQ